MACPPACAHAFTLVPFPAAFTSPSWSFDSQRLYPLLQKHPLYTPDPALAHVHVIPHKQPFGEDEYAGQQYYDWMAANYPPWNESLAAHRANFVLFHFCDHLTDCHYFGRAGFWDVDPAYSPLSETRIVRHVVWNGRADGATRWAPGTRAAESPPGSLPIGSPAPGCSACVQLGKDLVVPTAENACGPFCGGDINTLRRWAVWNDWDAEHRGPSSRTPIRALEYVREWGPRPMRVFWAGTIPPHVLQMGTQIKYDLSGRGLMYATHRDTPGYHMYQTYDWDANRPSPLGTPMLEMMRNATFCFSPLGTHGGDQDRFLPAILTGCIPIMLRTVLTTDTIKARVVFPYEGGAAEAVRWDDVAVVIDVEDVPRLNEILDAVDVASKRAHMHTVWRKLLWTSVYGSYLGESGTDDAFQNTVRWLTETR